MRGCEWNLPAQEKRESSQRYSTSLASKAPAQEEEIRLVRLVEEAHSAVLREAATTTITSVRLAQLPVKGSAIIHVSRPKSGTYLHSSWTFFSCS